jgi:hypothetical protein
MSLFLKSSSFIVRDSLLEFQVENDINHIVQIKKNINASFTPIENTNYALITSKSSDSLAKRDIKETFSLFSYHNTYDSFAYNYDKVFIEHTEKSNTITKNIQFLPHNFQLTQLNWTLFIGLISISLILTIKANYQKFLGQVLSSIINFQLINKMFYEKNILLRRAFFILNLNFVLIFSLFLLLLSIFFNIKLLNNTFLNYLMILSVFIFFLVFRYSMFHLSGLLFNKQLLISEYLHNKYLINKNIGIILFPILFISIYSSSNIFKFLLTITCALIVIASLVKIIRGFKIIMRNGILLFYTILYLCTLELLPLVLGSKIFISLR